MLSNLTFASFLVYAPRGTSDLSKNAQHFVRALKEERLIGDPPKVPSEYAARRLKTELQESVLADFFRTDCVLVPVPRSTLTVEGGLWPARNIALGLAAQGIGARVLPALERIKPIRKSAFQSAGARPTAQDHYDTMLAKKMVLGKETLCLVDDVITKGSTILAAATRLQETFPDSSIVAFALVRTMGFIDDIERIIEPVIGSVMLDASGIHRVP